MPPSPRYDLLPLLTRALTEELGLLVRSQEPKTLQNRLYQVRTAVKDQHPELMGLVLFLPASGDKVLITKKSVELEP